MTLYYYKFAVYQIIEWDGVFMVEGQLCESLEVAKKYCQVLYANR